MPLLPVILSGLIALTLIGLGAYYLVHEALEWGRNGGYVAMPREDASYFRSQFYRRLIGSSLLVAVGAAIFAGLNLIDPHTSPRLFIWFWLGVMLAVAWLLLISAADLAAIRRYARRHARELRSDHTALMVESRTLLGRGQGNGQWRDGAGGPTEPGPPD